MNITPAKPGSRPLALAGAVVGRLLASFMFLAAAFNHIRYWGETIAEMRVAGVTLAPDFLLATALAVSCAAAICLLFNILSNWAVLVLAAYCVVVSWELHNPSGGEIQMMLFIKDVTIAGAFLLYATKRPADSVATAI